VSSDHRDHLTAIYHEHGYLTPRLVVDVATDDAHPLHGAFEWDDRVAGHKYRVVQARELIRTAKMVTKEPTETEPGQSARAFLSVPTPESSHSYVPTDIVGQDPLLRRMALQQMEHEWKALMRRYRTIQEFWDMVAGDAEAA
jgi:hypothetical protein